MRLSNRDGTPVDPVPFLVVALLGVTVFLSWGPVYLLGLNVSLSVAVGTSVSLAAVAVVVAYYWFVWTANPNIREEVPADVRFRNLLYAIVIGIVVTLALLVIQVI